MDLDLAPYVEMSFAKHFNKGVQCFNENYSIEAQDITIDNIKLSDSHPRSYAFAMQETKTECLQAAVIESLKNITFPYRGSSNKRIIDIQANLSHEDAILL